MADNKNVKKPGRTSSGKTKTYRQNRHVKAIMKAEAVRTVRDRVLESCIQKYGVTKGKIKHLIGTLNVRRVRDLHDESLIEKKWFNNRVPTPSLYASVRGTRLEKFTNYMKIEKLHESGKQEVTKNVRRNDGDSKGSDN
jgi:hypothetical protein